MNLPAFWPVSFNVLILSNLSSLSKFSQPVKKKMIEWCSEKRLSNPLSSEKKLYIAKLSILCDISLVRDWKLKFDLIKELNIRDILTNDCCVGQLVEFKLTATGTYVQCSTDRVNLGNSLCLLYLLTYLLTYLPTYLLTYFTTYLLTYLPTYLLTFLLTYLLTYFTYLLTYLFTYLLTYRYLLSFFNTYLL